MTAFKYLRRAYRALLNTLLIVIAAAGAIAFGAGYLFVFVWIPFSPLFQQ